MLRVPAIRTIRKSNDCKYTLHRYDHMHLRCLNPAQVVVFCFERKPYTSQVISNYHAKKDAAKRATPSCKEAVVKLQILPKDLYIKTKAS